MSSSNSNLPVIILVVIAILALGGFYYADRSSATTDIAAITDSPDTESMISSKQKYQTDKSVYSHSGFNGSVKDYLDQTGNGMSPSEDVKNHSGYSGSGDDYVSEHSSNDVAMMESNASNHSGFSGSIKDYAKGEFDARSAPVSSKSSQKAATKSSSSAKSHSGHDGSVEDYLNKYK